MQIYAERNSGSTLHQIRTDGLKTVASLAHKTNVGKRLKSITLVNTAHSEIIESVIVNNPYLVLFKNICIAIFTLEFELLQAQDGTE